MTEALAGLRILDVSNGPAGGIASMVALICGGGCGVTFAAFVAVICGGSWGVTFATFVAAISGGGCGITFATFVAGICGGGCGVIFEATTPLLISCRGFVFSIFGNRSGRICTTAPSGNWS